MESITDLLNNRNVHNHSWFIHPKSTYNTDIIHEQYIRNVKHHQALWEYPSAHPTLHSTQTALSQTFLCEWDSQVDWQLCHWVNPAAEANDCPEEQQSMSSSTHMWLWHMDLDSCSCDWSRVTKLWLVMHGGTPSGLHRSNCRGCRHGKLFTLKFGNKNIIWPLPLSFLNYNEKIKLHKFQIEQDCHPKQQVVDCMLTRNLWRYQEPTTFYFNSIHTIRYLFLNIHLFHALTLHAFYDVV